MKPATDEELMAIEGRKETSLTEDRRDIYNLGVEYGRQLAAEDRPLWPEPITDRPPTEADADPDGLVQFRYVSGRWDADEWDIVARDSKPWQHTPKWQPKPPTLKEQALEACERACFCTQEDKELIRRALEAQP